MENTQPTPPSPIKPEAFQIKEDKLDYGNVFIKEDHSKEITLVNNSPVKIEFTAFTHQVDSIFKPVTEATELGPKSELKITVVCHPTKIGRWTDTLSIIVMDGPERNIELEVQALGPLEPQN